VAFSYHRNAADAGELLRSLEQLGRSAYAESVDIQVAETVAAFVRNVMSKFGSLTTLVYASGPRFAPNFVGRIAPEEWGRVIDADVKGFFNVVVAALPHLRKARGASITAITTAAVVRPPVLDALSAAPKAAIQSLIHSLALEEGRYGIRANSVAPGFINGGFGQQMLEEMTAEQRAQIVKGTPLGRLGTPEEVADAVNYLSSPRAAFITGNRLTVSGGFEL
jgi:NAD(P)-dependent dehydrogenase (short-subunit alcohol dehydrogenase family)